MEDEIDMGVSAPDEAPTAAAVSAKSAGAGKKKRANKPFAAAAAAATARDATSKPQSSTAEHHHQQYPSVKNKNTVAKKAPPVNSGSPHSGTALDLSSLQLDPKTARAILAFQNPHVTRQRDSQLMSASPAASSPPPAATPAAATTFEAKPSSSPAPVPSTSTSTKKRPTPKNASKAGGAPRKPKAKKGKVDKGNDTAGTPASVAGKKKGLAKKSQSATPMTGASPEPEPGNLDDDDDDDDESVEDENAVYCICRKPDNHTWMIGCDGGCDDWYHGKCVDMRQEDEQLLDKFICPICSESSGKVTTWKPMCRLQGCRKPARLKKGAESKYCSDNCGREFMKRMIQRTAEQSSGRGKKNKSGQGDVGPLGGPITVSELKALVDAAHDAASFRSLGDLAPPTPPDSNAGQSPHAMEIDEPSTAPAYEPYEQTRLDEIAARKAQLYKRRMILKSRQKFVMMTRDRVQRLKQATKDLCGYDPRLALEENAFQKWVEGEAGRAVMEKDQLADPPSTENMPSNADDYSICLRRKCKKHADWQKLSLVDVRFDEAEVGDEMRQIDAEETTLKQAGMVRARKRNAGIYGDEDHADEVEEIMDDS